MIKKPLMYANYFGVLFVKVIVMLISGHFRQKAWSLAIESTKKKKKKQSTFH